jgi:hypothetical protein
MKNVMYPIKAIANHGNTGNHPSKTKRFNESEKNIL